MEFNKFLNEMSQVDVEMEEDVKEVKELLLSFENVSPAQLNKAIKKTKEDENETVVYSFEDKKIQGKKPINPTKSPVKVLSVEEMKVKTGGNGRRLAHKVKEHLAEAAFYTHGVHSISSFKLS